MSISKNLPHHNFNSSLLIITGFVMLLSMVGCDACKKGTTGDEITTALQVTLTPSQLEGSKREAMLAIATKDEKNKIARLKDFDIKWEVSGVGETLQTSQVQLKEYDASGKESLRTIQLADNKAKEVITGPLYKYFIGREDATLDYGEEWKTVLKIVPDMGSSVKSMKIAVTITNKQTGEPIFGPATVDWQRSRYDFIITGLDPNGFITNNKCALQVTRKGAGASIGLNELGKLGIEVKQVPNDPADPHFNEASEQLGKQVITFGSDELKKDGKIEKELTVNPGTSGKETAFTLVLTSAGSKEPEAVAIVKYTPAAVIPYTLEVDKTQLVGADKDFVVTVKDARGQDLDAEKLKNLKLKVQRTEGQVTKLDIDPAGNKDFEVQFKDGNVLTLTDSKTATKSFTLDTGNDSQAAFECVLVDSSGKTAAVGKLAIQWKIGIGVEIIYDDKTGAFKCTLTNNTGADIPQLKSEWDDVDNVGVKLGRGAPKKGDKGYDIKSGKNAKKDLKMYWNGHTEAKIRFTVTTNSGIVVFQKEYSIVAKPPHLSITLENGPGPFKVSNQVQLKIKADENVDEDGLKKAKFQYTSSNEAELAIGGQNAQGKNIQELLALGGKGNLDKLLKNAEHTLSFTIIHKNLSGGSFTRLTLENSYLDTAKPNIVAKIDWEGETKVIMKPSEPLKVINNVLIANGNKVFNITFTNGGEFPLGKEQLEKIPLSIDPKNPNEPDEVSYKTIDLMKPPVTLWGVCQEMGRGELKPGEEIKIPFVIIGTKKSIEFAVKLTIDGVDTTQQVKWGSECASQVEIVKSEEKLFTRQVKGNNLIKFSIDVKNISGNPLDETALGKIRVGFGQLNAKAGTIQLKDPKSNVLNENIKAKIVVGKKIEWSDNAPITLAQILKEDSKNSLAKDGPDSQITIELSMTLQPTNEKRNFLVCLLDEDGVVISAKEVKEP